MSTKILRLNNSIYYNTISFKIFRWNHTPFDEASASGFKDIADLLSEGIRRWEEEEIKDEFESANEDDALSNECNATYSCGVEQPSKDPISNKINLFIYKNINNIIYFLKLL
jgi:hypothetical protein